jgi:SAM-dependent methyltransferase
MRQLAELFPDRPAAATFSSGESWIVVRDEIALPLPGEELLPLAAGCVSFASVRSPDALPGVHTLSEFQRATFSPEESTPARPQDSPALAFTVSDFPPRDDESIAAYLGRLLSPGTPGDFPPQFAAVAFDDCGAERVEVIRHFPPGIRRLLDVGCSSGVASAALCCSHPDLSVTGIEREPGAAELARDRLDRVLEGDAIARLSELADAGERFDAFLFADVLEHLEDPIRALVLARQLALSGATLVASVPNVGHLSIVRDLLRGRFDPVPAGLADAGHLRWFTRTSLEEWLQEAGWRMTTIESLPGAAAPDTDEFLRLVDGWPELDRESLLTYQWVAVGKAK